MSTPVITEEPKPPARPRPPPISVSTRSPTQLTCPICNTRVITEVQRRCCPPFSFVHVCPQCNSKISQSQLDQRP
ncbi:unnamed protein product, partial [Mesorhabditis spiculigera]